MRQLHLLETDNAVLAQVAGLTALVRAAMNRAADASPWSRQQIVDRMNALAKQADLRLTQGNAKAVSLDTLEKWLNPRAGFVPSLLAVEVFMRACGNTKPLEAWMDLHGMQAMSAEDAIYRDLGKAARERKKNAKREKALEAQLEELQ